MHIIIKDAVHGSIRISEFERKLIDTKELQRLRRIKQLALSYLVYPGANHTRFEHSLGTLHLTNKLCESLGLKEEEETLLRCVALLHDIGHSAFSHELEGINIKTHEERGMEIIRNSKIGEVIEKQGYSLNDIEELIEGRGLGKIITWDLGSDRMDYLLRDAHYTGVAYGVIDHERLIETTKLYGKDVVIDEGGIEAAESLLIARFLMFSAVYLHHAVRIASGMLNKAIRFGIEEGVVDIENICKYDDISFTLALKNGKKSREIIERIETRRLFKRAYEVEWNKLNKRGKKELKNIKKLETVISEYTNTEKEKFIVDFSTHVSRSNVMVVTEKEKNNLNDISEIVRSLEKAEMKRRKVIIACEEKILKKFSKKCKEFFTSFL